jgi:hypothetical protein
MTKLEKIIVALRDVQIEPTATEVADLLWLARQIGPVQLAWDRTVRSPMQPGEEGGFASKPDEHSSLLKPDETLDAAAQVFAPGRPSTLQTGMRGLAFQSPAASALPGRLGLARAIRPLKRRVPSRINLLFDEEKTVQCIAYEKIWLPQTRPAPERWLDVALIVDESASMVIWYKMITELQRLLEHHGAFRDVRPWGLVTDNTDGKVWLHAGFGPKARRGRSREPAELIDPAGRRLILVVSDCMAASWYDGQVNQLLIKWARYTPVTIIQVLPERLWLRSALSEATAARVCALSVRSPIQRRHYKLHDPWLDTEPRQPVAIPVVTLEALPLANWARMLVSPGTTWVLARLLELDNATKPAASSEITKLYAEHDQTLSLRQRVHHFRATASPLARKLAGLLATVPLRLPIMHLVQQTMLPESRQVHLAEFFLSGLLRQNTPDAELRDPDDVDYAFIKEEEEEEDEVRNLLLERVPADTAIEVRKHVSRFIEQEDGRPGRFKVSLENPDAVGELQITEGSISFATISAQILRRYGDDYARLADRLSSQEEHPIGTPRLEQSDYTHLADRLPSKSRYSFFFSYASMDYENAKREVLIKTGYHEVNHLENFFNDVCREVGQLTGEPHDKVGYRDKDRLSIADFWSKQLVEGLQNSSVLLAIISPAYLKSENCGREVQFFKERLNMLETNATQQQLYHRIIPVFWVDLYSCFKGLNENISTFIKALQWNQKDMPENYLSMGVAKIYNLMEAKAYAQVVDQISRRIVELADLKPPLPKLPDVEDDFRALPSAFSYSEVERKSTRVASGLTYTNVVYVVANSQEMAEAGYSNTDTYNNQPEKWRPFADAPNVTIEQATQEGVKKAGQIYHNLEFSENLAGDIEAVRESESSVLMVLDRCALSIPNKFKRSMQKYDQQNYHHVGLVIVGGSSVENGVLEDTFPFKFVYGHSHHSWTVPDSCQAYIDSVNKVVGEVVTSLKRRLQQTAQPSGPSIPMPTLRSS